MYYVSIALMVALILLALFWGGRLVSYGIRGVGMSVGVFLSLLILAVLAGTGAWLVLTVMVPWAEAL